MEKSIHYFQFKHNQDYPIYLQVESELMHSKYLHIFEELGFSERTIKDLKNINFWKKNCKILQVKLATGYEASQIEMAQSMDKYGQETLSLKGTVPLYIYRKVVSMIMPQSPFWEMKILHPLENTDKLVGLRVSLTRFLAAALAPLGILSFWGVYHPEGMVIMKQIQSMGEALFIDIQKSKIYSNAGEKDFVQGIKIYRFCTDKRSHHGISREDLISFLSVNTCLLSFNGLSVEMQKSLMSLSLKARGYYISSLNTPEKDLSSDL